MYPGVQRGAHARRLPASPGDLQQLAAHYATQFNHLHSPSPRAPTHMSRSAMGCSAGCSLPSLAGQGAAVAFVIQRSPDAPVVGAVLGGASAAAGGGRQVAGWSVSRLGWTPNR